MGLIFDAYIFPEPCTHKRCSSPFSSAGLLPASSLPKPLVLSNPTPYETEHIFWESPGRPTEVEPEEHVSNMLDTCQWLDELAMEHSQHTYIGSSSSSAKHDIALFGRTRRRCSPTRYLGEICHVDAHDGAVHVRLHPDDAKVALAAGCARSSVPSKLGSRHSENTILYPPTDEGDLRVIKYLVELAIAFMLEGEQ